MYSRIRSERSEGGTETTELAGVGLETAADRTIKALHRVVHQLDIQLQWAARHSDGPYPDGYAWPSDNGRIQLSGQESKLHH